MRKAYIRVVVYEDGQNELTRLELDSEIDQLRGSLNTGELYFEAQTEIPVLRNELVSYGHEETDIDEAIAYVLGSCNGHPCIIGKI